MYNPFDAIIERLDRLEQGISTMSPGVASPPIEVIDREELCKRLSVTEATVIRWEKKGAIPSMRIGANARYNWPVVVEALEKKGGSKR